MYDPAMQLPRLEAAQVEAGIRGAKILAGNDYEFGMMAEKMGLSKDAANDCRYFSPRTSWERETSSVVASKPSEPSGAKKAFDDLFK